MTAQSIQQDTTRINLPLETKRELVKIITAQPLLLDKIDLQNQIINNANNLNANLQNQLNNREQLITNLELQIKALEKEKKLFNTQLKKQKLKSVKVGALGLIALITVLIVN